MKSFSFFQPIWIIAKNNFKEIIREKLLYGIMVIALLVTGSSFFLSTISFDQNSRVLQNIGLAAIHLFAVFIALFMATTSLQKDFDRRTLYLLFPKPISRAQYILGKYLGLLLILLTTLLVLGGLFTLGSFFIDHGIVGSIILNLVYSFFEISLLIALAILFATFTATLNAFLYSLAFFIIGHALLTIKEYMIRIGNIVLERIVTVCYYFLPNLDKFDIRSASIYQIYPSFSQIGWSLAYWLIYTSLLLFLAILVIKKREF